ncbi:MAG: serine/threonine-protein phosphatase, partial [Actinomycetota bacterium]
MAELKWGSGTHAGQIRAQNEDSVLADDGIFVVADGMGGHEAGEVASGLAIDRLRTTLGGDRLTAHEVVEAITSANGDIFRAAIAN